MKAINPMRMIDYNLPEQSLVNINVHNVPDFSEGTQVNLLRGISRTIRNHLR